VPAHPGPMLDPPMVVGPIADQIQVCRGQVEIGKQVGSEDDSDQMGMGRAKNRMTFPC
jgi:hypothetical protein